MVGTGNIFSVRMEWGAKIFADRPSPSVDAAHLCRKISFELGTQLCCSYGSNAFARFATLRMQLELRTALDGKLKRRILDYHKLSKAFDFQGIRRHPANKHSSETQSVLDQMKNAANVFWFGDLNFRVAKTKESDGLGKRLEDRLFRKALDYEAILLHDELSLEIAKGRSMRLRSEL